MEITDKDGSLINLEKTSKNKTVIVDDASYFLILALNRLADKIERLNFK